MDETKVSPASIIRRASDDSLRAMFTTVTLVLVAIGGLVLAARDTPRGGAAEVGARTRTPLPATLLAAADRTAIGTPPPTLATHEVSSAATGLASPLPTPARVEPTSLTEAFASPAAGTSVVAESTDAMGATVVATASASAPTVAMTDTPTPVPSPTPVPFTPTPAPTDTPVPTPTPVMMSLRTDLPAMSLQDWPRPANDNGWGMHFLIDPYPTEEAVDLNIQRLVDLHIKWALVIYGDEIQLQKMAPRFRDAGITVVWRKYLNASDRYYNWARDIAILQSLGMPPYMQVYNEPTSPVEWTDGRPNDAVLYDNLAQAAQDIYNAGGYFGLQSVSQQQVAAVLQQFRARGGEAVFGRMFFVPHCYGMNHPPDYVEDINSVLSFRNYADTFMAEIGFVPPMIVGEGGWKWGATDDARYPKVSDELHRDYYVELYSWFSTGILSNGEPLPDYLFAFCPWLIAHKMDDNAFYDSFAGDRVMTLDAIKAIPPFVRTFSWD